MELSTFARLQSQLIEKEGLTIGYSAIMAEHALYRFEPEIRDAVMLWLDGTLTNDFAAAGMTIEEVLENVQGSQFMALCILDIAAKDPTRVEEATWNIGEDNIYVD